MRTQTLVRNVLLWLIPVAVVWIGMTHFYNRFLTVSAENLIQLTESPNVTQLLPNAKDRHYISVLRSDFPPAKRIVSNSIRVTDIHYHLVMLGALFLAVPGVPFRQRLGKLGWAVLITVFFDILLLFLWVKFVYATQLGDWSTENYGAFGQNFYGLAKHVMDLPFKLGLPLALWVVLYFPQLREGRGAREAH